MTLETAAERRNGTFEREAWGSAVRRLRVRGFSLPYFRLGGEDERINNGAPRPRTAGTRTRRAHGGRLARRGTGPAGLRVRLSVSEGHNGYVWVGT